MIDFGGYQCSPVITHLVNALYSAEPEIHEKHHDELMRAFIDGVAEMGGPRYDLRSRLVAHEHCIALH